MYGYDHLSLYSVGCPEPLSDLYDALPVSTPSRPPESPSLVMRFYLADRFCGWKDKASECRALTSRLAR